MKALPASSLSGTWTSTHCETRPGPEFILRRYIFDPSTSSNASFSVFGVIYHYADPSCSAPLQAVTFSGQITSSNSSVLVPGAMSSEFLLQHAWLRYYMSEVAMKAEKKIEQNCGELGSSTEIDYPVYTDGGSQECLEALNLSFWELQLFRLEQKREILKGRKPHQPRLFLGDIHTTPKMEVKSTTGNLLMSSTQLCTFFFLSRALEIAVLHEYDEHWKLPIYVFISGKQNFRY